MVVDFLKKMEFYNLEKHFFYTLYFAKCINSYAEKALQHLIKKKKKKVMASKCINFCLKYWKRRIFFYNIKCIICLVSKTNTFCKKGLMFLGSVWVLGFQKPINITVLRL